jgi:hypothetical protein
MKILFASLWVFLFSLIIFIVSYEAYLSPNETNHAVSFAMVAFSLINLPVGLLNIINPFWTQLTDIGLSLGLPIAWAEAAHIIVTNGLLGYLWWFRAVPAIKKFVQS